MVGYEVRWSLVPIKLGTLRMPGGPENMPPPECRQRPLAVDAPESLLGSFESSSRPTDVTKPPLARLAQEDSPVNYEATDFGDLVALAGQIAVDDGGLGALLNRPLSEPSGDDWRGSMTQYLLSDADAGVDKSDPLAVLSLEYQQALLSPQDSHRVLGPTVAAAGGRIVDLQRTSPIDFPAPPQSEASVLDLLTQGKNIDTLLEGLDAFGAGMIFEADERHEILALLAPSNISQRPARKAEHFARSAYHTISVDSPMRLPDSMAPLGVEQAGDSHR